MSQQLVASVATSVKDDKESLPVATTRLCVKVAAGRYSRLGGVEWIRAVPHILGAVENTES